MAIQLFDDSLFSQLQDGAAQSPRRRLNHNIHSDLSDPVQRLFITLMPDSYVRPHRHSQSDKWEFFLMLEGTASFVIFSQEGEVLARHTLCAQGPLRGLEIPPGTWHSVVALEQPATFLEVKQGPYQALSAEDMANWAPAEGEPEVQAFLQRLKGCQVGDKFNG
ncbi:WbuC family cupin fold metalloprotein [Bowmanella yangjiangensis]|uniref:WbuC family cupin fold metalloprotein n=1 Tax=Bowmanella yangjiangensis TaxID=2811230 RepID=UPI001E342630|nr:WbuC family cupin fold metalloprotein [Bowmanella yangjiangensis]